MHGPCLAFLESTSNIEIVNWSPQNNNMPPARERLLALAEVIYHPVFRITCIAYVYLNCIPGLLPHLLNDVQPEQRSDRKQDPPTTAQGTNIPGVLPKKGSDV